MRKHFLTIQAENTHFFQHRDLHFWVDTTLSMFFTQSMSFRSLCVTIKHNNSRCRTPHPTRLCSNVVVKSKKKKKKKQKESLSKENGGGVTACVWMIKYECVCVCLGVFLCVYGHRPHSFITIARPGLLLSFPYGSCSAITHAHAPWLHWRASIIRPDALQMLQVFLKPIQPQASIHQNPSVHDISVCVGVCVWV